MIISEGRRLAYYSVKANSGFWSRHWRKSIKTVEWKKAEQGFLGWFEEPFIKYLSKAGKIIEAGCGLGYYVLALGRRGYNIEGVEWSREAVRLIKKRYPKLKIKTGDVRKLAVKDGYYSGYISLGVVEHFRSGPEDYLREANRVLKSGGVVFISVPHFNLLRRIKNLLGLYNGNPVGLDFYQYAFTETEIDGLIEKAGFKVIDHFRYDAYKGIKEELPFLHNLLWTSLARWRKFTRSLSPFAIAQGKPTRYRSGWPQTAASSLANLPTSLKIKVRNSYKRPQWLKLADRYFGHMTMVICEKLS